MHTPPLISAGALLNVYGSTNPPLIVDCRHRLDAPEAGEADYLAGHLPGAVHAHLEKDLSGPAGPSTGRHPLPEQRQTAMQLGRLGISPETHVIAYDDMGGTMAARLWWMLHWVGHDRVQVLDGGLRAWLEVGGILESGRVEPVRTELPLRQPGVKTCEQGEIRQGLQEDSALRLIDVRTAERFQGISEPLDPVAGHVPGARNLPHALTLDAEARFREPGELRALFNGIAVDDDPQDVVVMCGSGVSACHTILAMRQAGMTGPRLYPGSWSEWIRDPDNPVATGKPE